jgi:hypothetical protein
MTAAFDWFASHQYPPERGWKGEKRKTYSIISRLFLRPINNNTRHTRHHNNRPLHPLFNHILPSLSRKQKSAIDIDIQHFLPLCKVIVFGGFSACDSCIRTQNVYFAKVVEDLCKGFFDCGFVGGIAFVGVEGCGGETGGLDFGVDG